MTRHTRTEQQEIALEQFLIRNKEFYENEDLLSVMNHRTENDETKSIDEDECIDRAIMHFNQIVGAVEEEMDAQKKKEHD